MIVVDWQLKDNLWFGYVAVDWNSAPCQFFPIQYLIYSVTTILWYFREFEEPQQVGISWLWHDGLPHKFKIYGEAAGILERNAVVKNSDRRMNLAKIISVGKEIDKSLTYAIELWVVIRSNPIFSRGIRFVDSGSKALQDNIVILPDVFLLLYAIGVSCSCILYGRSGNLHIVYKEIRIVTQDGINVAEHQLPPNGKQTIWNDTCFYCKFCVSQSIVWEIRSEGTEISPIILELLVSGKTFWWVFSL